MILKNKNGIERNFKILFELENDSKKYIVYEDINTKNVYGGKLNNKKIEKLNEEELKVLNNTINRLVER